MLLVAVSLYATIPPGFYHLAKNKSKAQLKSSLKLVSSPLQVLNYGSGIDFTWHGFFYTDRRSDSTVIDMYSPIVRRQTNYMGVAGMHIEHSLPKSWWGSHENMAYKDLFHLYPADGITNSTKNNLPLGEVVGVPLLDNGVSKVGRNGFGTFYAENSFEPSNEFKGDFARSYLYISSIYEDYAHLWKSPMMLNNTYPVWRKWAIDLLLKWHRQDPVSPKELSRNEVVFRIQGNRNPFIDYPALAEYIWGADSINVFPFPDETNAFLISPHRAIKLNFGTIMTNVQRTEKLHVQGVNVSGNVALRIKNATAAFQLSLNDLLATDVANGIDVHLTFSPTESGTFRDTLIVSGGGLSSNVIIPIVANVSPDFIVVEPTNAMPRGGELHWISHPEAIDYRLTVFEPAQKAGDLFISTYVEGSSWNKAIEIFNGTGNTVDLSKYTLRKQSNGDGAFGSLLRLSGQLANNRTYTIVHRSATNSTLLSRANLLTDTLLQINGNDAISLSRNGLLVDMVGQAHAGADVIWGLDLTLQRKPTITHPASVFKMSEWNVLPLDSVAFVGTHQMAIPAIPLRVVKQVNTGTTTSYVINDLSPEKTYTYSVVALKQQGEVEAMNTMQLHTTSLEAPVIMTPTNITGNQFTANWDESLYAERFLLDVFTTSGMAETTAIEGFDGVTSNGTPLPTGWSSSAISTYTSTASSGIAIPSIQLNDNADWLSTRTYEAPVTRLAFMYRFASVATGSSLRVDALKNGQWLQVANIPYTNSTSKTYPVLNFSAAENYRRFQFVYSKVSGNLALDDVRVTYGKLDTVFIHQNQHVASNSFLVSNLQPNTSYTYRVRSQLAESVSVYSETMAVKTEMDTKTTIKLNDHSFLTYRNNSIAITGAMIGDVVRIYDSMGRAVFQKNMDQTSLQIPFQRTGIYIVLLQSKAGNRSEKIRVR